MALTSYSGLKTALQAWVNDRTDVASNVDDFIDLAEANFNQNLRCREMVTETDLSPTAGVFTLPSDYLRWRNVTELASSRRVLSYITKERADELYSDRTAGLGCDFTVVGSSIRVYPTITNDIELTYYQQIPALDDSNTTNWLLDRYPNVYLEAAQMEAYRYFKMDEDYQLSAARVAAMIDRINIEDRTDEAAYSSSTAAGPNP